MKFAVMLALDHIPQGHEVEAGNERLVREISVVCGEILLLRQNRWKSAVIHASFASTDLESSMLGITPGSLSIKHTNELAIQCFPMPNATVCQMSTWKKLGSMPGTRGKSFSSGGWLSQLTEFTVGNQHGTLLTSSKGRATGSSTPASHM